MTHDSESKNYSLRDFIPLITAFLLITVISLLKFFFIGPRSVTDFFADFMGVFFIIFGILKIIKLEDFVESYSMYDLITKRYRVYGYVYPFIEIILGVCYLIKFNLNFVNAFTFILMALGTCGVANALSKKREIQCACMGTVFQIPMTYVTLFEDLFMALMALIMLIV